MARISLVLVPLLVLLLGWRFNRSKPVYLVLVLLLAERALNYYAPVGAAITDADVLIVQVLALLLPLNFVLLSLGEERGLFSFHAWLRLLFIGLQPVLALLVANRYPTFLGMLQVDFLPLAPTLPGQLAQAGQLAFLLGLGFLLGRLLLRRGAMDNGFFWALVAVWQELAFATGQQVSILFGVAGMILVCAILEAAHSMAFRDELTGLPSRRALNEYFLQLSGPFSVAMLDVDFFKKFNDVYGHDIGDQVLKMVASRIGRVRGGGRPFRYGGKSSP